MRGRPTRRVLPRAVGALFVTMAVSVLACGAAPTVTGVVERVDDEYEQVVITQPGFGDVLPAGTTTLSAAESVRTGLEPGQIVEVEVVRASGGPEIRSARFVRWAGEADGWIESAGRHVPVERAEPIALVDTSGRPVSLAGLAGSVVLVDFIYTSCPGPCPAQTHNMRRVQRGLSDEARQHVRFISVTIDPETDDGPTLAEYAARHHADLENWSFLTGPVAEVEDTYTRYGIGVTEGAGGSMDHTLRSFVVDDRGYLVDRYRSDRFDAAAVVQRLEALAGAATARSGS